MDVETLWNTISRHTSLSLVIFYILLKFLLQIKHLLYSSQITQLCASAFSVRIFTDMSLLVCYQCYNRKIYKLNDLKQHKFII
jgi:hypothetical protein